MNTSEYEKIKPKQFGNMYERLKFLIKLVNNQNIPCDIYHAIFDLEASMVNNKRKLG